MSLEELLKNAIPVNGECAKISKEGEEPQYEIKFRFETELSAECFLELETRLKVSFPAMILGDIQQSVDNGLRIFKYTKIVKEEMLKDNLTSLAVIMQSQKNDIIFRKENGETYVVPFKEESPSDDVKKSLRVFLGYFLVRLLISYLIFSLIEGWNPLNWSSALWIVLAIDYALFFIINAKSIKKML